MEVKTIKVGFLETNCYVVFDGDNSEASVIDPGAEVDAIYGFIRSRSLRVKNIFLTHGHFDHIMGVQQLKSLTGARVVIHEADAECLENAHAALYSSIMQEPFRVSKADIRLKGSEKTRVGTVDAEFINTPGHTPGSMCILMDNILFTGDTLFAGDAGRTDLVGGDAGDLRASLRLLYLLPHDYIVYPGHGEPTSLGIERETNDFLREAAGIR